MKCHVCGSEAELGNIGVEVILCPRCGPWVPMNLAAGVPLELRLVSPREAVRRSNLSRRIRRSQSEGKAAYGLDYGTLDVMSLDERLPGPREQIDELLLWVGVRQASFTEEVVMPMPEVSAWLGMPIDAHPPTVQPLLWLLTRQQTKHYLDTSGLGQRESVVSLTFAGWDRLRELQTQAVESRTAFMALQFGDTDLDNMINAAFKPAAMRAGFELRLLTDGQPAGLIDDQIRVALRRARFVVADLTHHNRGAYWEAGFAEGLGRPVIYTCRRETWDAGGVHFDTSHLNTVIWEVGGEQDAANRLAATIRATLPEEARLTD